MGLNDYLQCPGLDKTLSIFPEIHLCPACGSDVEIWTDEKNGKCRACGLHFSKLDKRSAKVAELIEQAHSLGASDATIIPSASIRIDDALASCCTENRCENYGLSMSCPPHVSGPDGFRKLQASRPDAIVIRIALPQDVMFSAARPEVARLLHHIVATVESAAVDKGFPGARGFAGGSCKRAFCHNHAECRVLSGDGQCRNPDDARPSLSGFGVDVNRLVKTCGWSSGANANRTDTTEASMAWIVGLVLI